jgi:hypothetical protein
MAKTIITTFNDVETWSSPMKEKEAEIDRLVALAESERNEQVIGGLSELQAGQLEQNKKLQESYKALRKLSLDLLGPIDRIDRQLLVLENDLERKSRDAILESVSGIKFIIQHKLANYGLVPDSGQWFLNKQPFQQWRDESCSSILWLHGIPGSGKTKLTSMVVSEMKKNTHVAYFYAVRNPIEPERAESAQIIRSLVRQLACPSAGGPILAPVLAKYEDALEGLEGYTDVMWMLDDAIETLIELCDLYPAVILIIDALDEANPLNRLDLLDGLIRVMEDSKTLVKVFISSRESMDIFERLESKPNVRIDAQDNAEDIAKFVHRQLKAAKLLQGKLPDSLKQKIPEVLIAGAHGMFRWVDLQIQSLRPLKVAADIDERLGRLPHTLEESYVEIYQQILDSGEHASQLAIFTFQWLLYAQKPIAIADFAQLASIHLSPTLAHTPQNVLEVCQNLILSDDKGIFRFVHLSVREFLENLKEGKLEHRDVKYFLPGEGNAAIASVSLAYLRTTMSLDINQKANDLLKETQLDKNTVIKSYAVNYWPWHVSKSGQLRHSAPLSSNVRSFLVENKDVAPTFTQWCNLVREVKDVLPDIKKAAQHPPNPVFLVHTYDLLDIQNAAISDKDYQRQAFLYASGEGNCGEMSTLLEHGLDIEDVGISAMGRAIAAAKLPSIEMLKTFRIPVDPKFLLGAAHMRDTNVLRALISYDAKCIPATQLQLIFRIAISNGDDELLPIFLEQGITRDPVAVVRALKAAAPSSAIHLINAGFDIHGAYLLEQRTALHWAVDRGFPGIVQGLLEKGVEINPVDAWGNTPLHLAAWRGRVDATRLLVERLADEDCLNAAGQTALHLAALMGFREIVKALRHGTEATQRIDGTGKSPLMYALEYALKRDDDGVFQLLRENDWDVVPEVDNDIAATGQAKS